MKIKKYLVAIGIYIFLFLSIYLIHIKFFSINVIFYSAIFDGVISALITMIILFKIKYFSIYNNFEKSQISVLLFLLGYIFAISGPTVIDRSLSFYILEKLEQRGGGILESKFEDIFTKEYMYEYRLVDVRLTEQKESGTIKIENGCVKLTDKGYFLTKISKYFRKNLLPRERLLMGEYTDDLVIPLENGQINENAIVDYECK